MYACEVGWGEGEERQPCFQGFLTFRIFFGGMGGGGSVECVWGGGGEEEGGGGKPGGMEVPMN